MPTLLANNLEWLVAFLLGGAVLLLAQHQYRHQVRLEREGVVVTGTVCRLEYEGKVFYPVVRFQTHQREQITGRHRVGTNPASYRLGQVVAIRYHPADPHDFAIIAGRQALLVWGMAAMGVVLIAYGIFCLFKS